jgi:hypothetical protein
VILEKGVRKPNSPTPPDSCDLCWRRLGRESVPSCLAVNLSPECGVALVAGVVCEFGRSATRARDNVCRTKRGQSPDTREWDRGGELTLLLLETLVGAPHALGAVAHAKRGVCLPASALKFATLLFRIDRNSSA